ncbi:hypothetical protein B0H14DRAFT_3653365 [Mycena olivaceomarginata]|nr:hypothetical protein B0H14DRAFT_3653365 [Mycena olivaceomarginata]
MLPGMIAQRVRSEKSTPAVILMQRDTAVSIFEAERRQKQMPQSNTHQTLVAAQEDQTENHQHRGAERNWRGIGIQLTQYTADTIDVLAREFGAESKGSGQNRESGATEQGQERTFLQHTPENHISDVDPQRYRNSAPSTKGASSKGGRDGRQRGTQQPVNDKQQSQAHGERRFRLMQERQYLTTTVEKIHAVNMSDGGKEHAAPAQTTAS